MTSKEHKEYERVRALKDYHENNRNESRWLRYNQKHGAKRLAGHLESLFSPGMTWDNYGFEGWHIDHIKPCASFELDQKKICFHYTNLQPLWAKDNMSKSNKF